MRQLKTLLFIFLVMTLMLGVAYPLAITGAGSLLFHENAGGSLIESRGFFVGSELIGQMFTSPKYFHGRPSANACDGMNSGGSNLGPTNKKLAEFAALKAEAFRKENNLAPDVKIPAEFVYASGSGLDPHIGIESALMQTSRIARARHISQEAVEDTVRKNSEKFYFGLFGDPYVNVLKLNLALDAR